MLSDRWQKILVLSFDLMNLYLMVQGVDYVPYSIMHYNIRYIELEVKRQGLQGNDTSESRFQTFGIFYNSMSITSMHTGMSATRSTRTIIIYTV